MNKKYFSLVELLIVIGILGALCTLVLPGFNDAGEEAREKVAATEMKEVQSAFRRFSIDVMLKGNKDKMRDIVDYGLWPLMNENQPANAAGAISYPDYDSEIGIGRRGPYLRREGSVTMSASPGSDGQAKNAGGTVSIPVVKDPYGGYYRVICPAVDYVNDPVDTQKKKLRKMALVCTGPDRNLDTTSANVYDGEIAPQGDDSVIRLMPLATY